MNQTPRVAKPIGFEATIDLVVRGPVITKSSAIGPWGCDAVFSRDARGRLFFSGDHLKGKLREAFDRLQTEAFHDEAGRRRSRDAELIAGADEQAEHELSVTRQLLAGAKRYPAIFSDFIAVDEWPGPGVKRITRVKIDNETGAAASGNLRVVDCPIAPGQPATFRGDIRYFAASEPDASKQLDVILQALKSIAALGADQTIGSGVLLDVQLVGSSTVDFLDNAGRPASPEPRGADLKLEFHDPLCLPNGVVNGNLYESEDEIPGEAIKGAVASCLRQITGVTDLAEDLDRVEASHPLALLCHHLDKVLITRARPTTNAQPRPVTFPLSLAFFDETLADTALVPTTQPVIHNDFAPAFSHDWKRDQWKTVNQEFGYHEPQQELRVRTQIESARRRARDHSLFAYRLVRPEQTVWKSTVAIAECSLGPAEQSRLMEQFAAIVQRGWLHLGKTSARGTGQLAGATHRGAQQPGAQQPGKQQPAALQPIEVDGVLYFVVTLQSPALIIDPRQLWMQPGDNAAPDQRQLDDLYAAYWQEKCAPLQPIHARRFARHRLVGGYQAWRYRFAVDPAEDLNSLTIAERLQRQRTFPYNPSLLTEAGSVFVFQVQPDDVETCAQQLAHWTRFGLEVPAWAGRAYGSTHHTNPFRPDVGYGEIAVNLSCHTALLPTGNQELAAS